MGEPLEAVLCCATREPGSGNKLPFMRGPAENQKAVSKPQCSWLTSMALEVAKAATTAWRAHDAILRATLAWMLWADASSADLPVYLSLRLTGSKGGANSSLAPPSLAGGRPLLTCRTASRAARVDAPHSQPRGVSGRAARPAARREGTRRTACPAPFHPLDPTRFRPSRRTVSIPPFPFL